MPQRLTDSVVRNLLPPATGSRITYDTEVKGFGCRVTAAGVRAFILNYHTRSGRERRYTIGQVPGWRVAAARQEAAGLKRRIDGGDDPMAELRADRDAPTVGDLCARFEAEHLPKTRPGTAAEYRAMIRNDIMPALQHLKVAEVTFEDVDGLHRQVTKRARYRANRVVATLSKMFSLATRWGWRSDNPARGIERNQEVKRHRYLSADELTRLTAALAAHDDQQAATIIRLLLLTGARRGEVLAARWDQFDLSAGIWTKPSALTKQKSIHRVPLSAPARQLLAEILTTTNDDSLYVFPGRDHGHRVNIKRDWGTLCKAANILGARLHDLRHTYASILAGAGLSLPIIGALLGHTQPATTARYAHLFDDPLRAATERVGAIVTGTPTTEIFRPKSTAE